MGAEVPHLLAAGAALFNEHQFWHAHEEWEKAWHALKRAGRAEDAQLVQGLILATAAFENLRRGKPGGARTQLGKAVALVDAHRARASPLGVLHVEALLTALESARANVVSGARSLVDLRSPPPRIEVKP